MKTHHRAIWISDLHLGSRGAQAEKLLEFLKHNSAETLYLVGDIIDLWALSRKIYFPPSHLAVMKKILAISKKHKVVYVIGNHDETIRDFAPVMIGDIEVCNSTIHTTVDGRRFLVTHGDEYDQVVLYARWLAVLGDWGYTVLLDANRYFNWMRRKFGLGYWSLSRYVKDKVKAAANFICQFEDAVIRAAHEQNLDGVICGHIHHAEIKEIGGKTYINDGDWVESCTALVEDFEGHLSIIAAD